MFDIIWFIKFRPNSRCAIVFNKLECSSGMRISRPKTQFIDFKFGQDNGKGREPVGSSVEDTGGMTTDISQRVSAAWGTGRDAV